MRLKRYKLSGLIAAMAILAGCVSVLPEPDGPDALYAIEAASERQNLAVSLLVRTPDAPQIVSGQAIAREDEVGAIRLIPKVEWSESAMRLLQLAIVESFGLEGDGTAVLSDTGLLAKYELLSHVRTFNLRGDDAVCAVDVMIVNVQTGQILDRSSVDIVRPVLSSRATDRARAMKDTAEVCVADIVDFAATSLNRTALAKDTV